MEARWGRQPVVDQAPEHLFSTVLPAHTPELAEERADRVYPLRWLLLLLPLRLLLLPLLLLPPPLHALLSLLSLQLCLRWRRVLRCRLCREGCPPLRPQRLHRPKLQLRGQPGRQVHQHHRRRTGPQPAETAQHAAPGERPPLRGTSLLAVARLFPPVRVKAGH
jgi:hypothetical protein